MRIAVRTGWTRCAPGAECTAWAGTRCSSHIASRVSAVSGCGVRDHVHREPDDAAGDARRRRDGGVPRPVPQRGQQRASDLVQCEGARGQLCPLPLPFWWPRNGLQASGRGMTSPLGSTATAFGVTGGQDPAAAKAPDLISRDFTADKPNTKYVGDITYLPLDGGKFCYLARVIDLASRRMDGRAIAGHTRADLVTDALAAAIRTCGSLAGPVMHTDHGAQHTSRGIRRSLQVSRGSAEHERGRVQRGQRTRRVLQRDLQTRDLARTKELANRARGRSGRRLRRDALVHLESACFLSADRPLVSPTTAAQRHSPPV